MHIDAVYNYFNAPLRLTYTRYASVKRLHRFVFVRSKSERINFARKGAIRPRRAHRTAIALSVVYLVNV